MQPDELVTFGIPEEAVTRICQNRARHMNSEAKLAGQSQRISALDLEDLYYKMRGRCAMCSVILEDHGSAKRPTSIRADHIVNVNRRSAFEARAAGRANTGALIADISNVQWVCHLCNTLKQIVVASGVDWKDHISRSHQECAAGFPLRNAADVCGSLSSRRRQRVAWMREQFAARGHCLSSYDVVRHFQGTQLEAGLPTVLKELKQIGWCGLRHMGEVRREIASEMCENALVAKTEKPCLKDWWRELNQLVSDRYGWPAISCAAFSKLCESERLSFPTTRVSLRTLQRNATSAEKALICQFLKEKGIAGATADELEKKLQSDTFTQLLTNQAIEELLGEGEIERHENVFFYCMERKEAARLIGVSPHKMKKYVERGNGPPFLKTPRNAKGKCYYSVRSFYPWLETRKKTRFDKVGWQSASKELDSTNSALA